MNAIQPELETWRKVWRRGFAPQLSTEALEVLLKALREDDPRLIQGATTSPPPLQVVQDWPAEACCIMGFCGAMKHGGIGVAKVVEVEEEFAEFCYQADQIFQEPAACRFFLNWVDETPREDMRREMIGEVELELANRKS